MRRFITIRSAAAVTLVVKANPLDNDFTVRVDFEEPVAGCTPPPSK